MTEPILSVAVQAWPPTQSGPPGIAVLRATGEIDHDSRAILQQVASDALEDGSHSVVIDLTGVTFCDSGGLSLFVDLHRRATGGGGWVRLAGASGMVLGVLQATNLDRMFTLYDTPHAAAGDA